MKGENLTEGQVEGEEFLMMVRKSRGSDLPGKHTTLGRRRMVYKSVIEDRKLRTWRYEVLFKRAGATRD